MPRRHYVLALSEADGILRASNLPNAQRFRGLVRPNLEELLVVTGDEIGGQTELTSGQLDTLAGSWGFSRAALDAAAVPGLDEGGDPDPGGDFPNEPTSLQIVQESSMDKQAPETCVAGVNPSPVDGWIGDWGNFTSYKDSEVECGNKRTEVIVDANAPVSPNYHSFEWPNGQSGGTGISNLVGSSTVGPCTRLYTGLWFRFADPGNGLYEAHPVTNKHGFWEVGGSGNRIFLNQLCHDEPNRQSEFSFRLDLQNDPLRTVPTHLIGASERILKVGQWQRWELDFVLNDPANNVEQSPSIGQGSWIGDGEMRVWIDGVKVIDVNDVAWITASNTNGFTGWRYGNTYGGIGNDKELQDDWTHISHVRLRGEEQI